MAKGPQGIGDSQMQAEPQYGEMNKKLDHWVSICASATS